MSKAHEGHVRIPNSLYTANRGDAKALMAMVLFEGDSYHGGLRSISEYARELGCGRPRIRRLMAIWRDTKAKPSDRPDVDHASTTLPSQKTQQAQEVTPQEIEPSTTYRPGTDQTSTSPSIYLHTHTQLQRTHTSLRDGDVSGSGSREGPSLTDRARALWPKLVSEAAKAGKKWSPEPGKRQLAIVIQRIRDAGEDACLLAVQGYRAKCETAVRRGSDWDGLAYFTVTSIFRPANFDANVDAAEQQAPEDPIVKARREFEAAVERGNLQ